jgi:hypothetical protein
VNKINNQLKFYIYLFKVSYKDIVEKVVTLGIWIAEEPAIILPYLNSIFYEIVIT